MQQQQQLTYTSEQDGHAHTDKFFLAASKTVGRAAGSGCSVCDLDGSRRRSSAAAGAAVGSERIVGHAA